MISKVSVTLTNRLIQNNIIKQEDFEIYRFGIENLIMKACHILSYVILGIIFQQLPELLVFLIAFIPLRESSGGYHAKTPLKCYILSCGTIISLMCLLRFIPVKIMAFGIVPALVSSLILFFIVPVEAENKPLDETEITYYKRKASFIIMAELVLVLVFRVLSWNVLSFILALSLTYELLIALAGIYVKVAGSGYGPVK